MLSPAEIVRKKRKMQKALLHEKITAENEKSHMKMAHPTTFSDELKKINTSPPFHVSSRFPVEEEITQIQGYSDSIDNSSKRSSSSNIKSYQTSKTKKSSLRSPAAASSSSSSSSSSLKINKSSSRSPAAAAYSSSSSSSSLKINSDSYEALPYEATTCKLKEFLPPWTNSSVFNTSSPSRTQNNLAFSSPVRYKSPIFNGLFFLITGLPQVFNPNK